MVFRWVLADCMSDLHEAWVAAEHGMSLDHLVVTHVAWADEAWVFDATQHGLHDMLRQVSPQAWMTIGLAIRVEKRAYSCLPEWGSMAPEVASKCWAATCRWARRIRGMGSRHAKMSGRLPHEKQLLAHTGVRRPDFAPIRLPGSRMMLGKRYWARRGAREAQALQLRMSRRAVQLWPVQSEGIQACFKRTARCFDRANQCATVPRWDTALLPSWWCWGGHIARLAVRDEARFLTAVVGWRDAIYREALRGLLWRRWDPNRQRLGRSHMQRP